MNCMKFDEEKVMKNIEAYRDQHGKDPYLIMNSKTLQMLPKESNYISLTSSGLAFGSANVSTKSIVPVEEIKVGDLTYVLKTSEKHEYEKWHGVKILIDEELELGVVYIG